MAPQSAENQLIQQREPAPPVCGNCYGRGQIEIHTISTDTCDGKSAQTVRHRKCHRCDGHGMLPPPNPEPSETGIWPLGAEPLQW